jgi:DNA-binding NarL/FixJ family response regulator
MNQHHITIGNRTYTVPVLTPLEQTVWELSNTEGSQSAGVIAALLSKSERTVQAVWNRACAKLEEKAAIARLQAAALPDR